MIEIQQTKKDHYRLILNGVDITGEINRTQIREIVRVIDHNITTN